MDDWRCKIMSQLKHVICQICKKGILTVLAEVGVEAQGTTSMALRGFNTNACVRGVCETKHTK